MTVLPANATYSAATTLTMTNGGRMNGTAAATAVPFILPPFVIVSVVAALYVAFAGSTMIQALFYGIGPAVIALILRGAWKLLRVTVKNDRRLWAIFGAIAAITFVVRSEVAILFVVSGLVGVILYAPPAWL